MSSRQLRKLRQQQDLLALEKANADRDKETGSDDDGGAPLDTPHSSKPKFAGFAALAGDEDEDEEDDNQEPAQDDPPETAKPAPEFATPVKKNKKSKKKKNKKGKEADTSIQPGKKPETDKDIDEIDRAIQELDLDLSKEQPAANVVTTANSDWDAELSFCLSTYDNFADLKVNKEMRHLFGKEAMKTADHEDEAQANSARGRRQRQPRQQQVDIETFLKAPPGKGIPDVMLRRNPFIEGKHSWPRGGTAGLSMAAIGDPKADVVEFAFTHDREYRQLEAQFFFLVGMYDPMKLVHFLQQYPYHISTLIQVSRIAHQDQNAAFAAELCERALFAFGRVTLSSFRKKLANGKARLSFKRPENRQFWLAGYHYIKNLIRKGTYRTAMAWSVVLLSLDRADPYGILNLFQVLAIRADPQHFLDLTCLIMANDVGPKPDNLAYILQTRILAFVIQGDIPEMEGAQDELEEGMQALPWLYTKLFGALNVDVPPNLWGIMPPNDDEQLRTDLYVHLMADLWNNTKAINLLKKVGSELPKFDPTRPKVSSPALQHLASGPVALSTARFVYLEGKPDLLSHVPRGMLHATPNFDFDPLPPPKEDNVFSYEQQKLPWTTNDNDDLGPDEVRVTGRPGDLLRMMAGGGLPGVADEQLEDLEALVEDQSVPEETRGLMRRFLDMIGGGGGGNGGGGNYPGGPAGADDDGLGMPFRMPGEFLDSDWEYDSEEVEDRIEGRNGYNPPDI